MEPLLQRIKLPINDVLFSLFFLVLNELVYFAQF